MKCANPKCCRDAQHLSDGILLLLEMDLPPEERLAGDEFGFPVCTAPSKYFWLCEACSRNLRIVGWTVAGPVLAPHHHVPTSTETFYRSIDVSVHNSV